MVYNAVTSYTVAKLNNIFSMNRGPIRSGLKSCRFQSAFTKYMQDNFVMKMVKINTKLKLSAN